MFRWHHPLVQYRKHHELLLFQPIVEHVTTIRKAEYLFTYIQPGQPLAGKLSQQCARVPYAFQVLSGLPLISIHNSAVASGIWHLASATKI